MLSGSPFSRCDVILDVSTEDDRSCLHVSTWDFDLHKHSYTLPRSDKHTFAATHRNGTLGPRPVITEHLLSIPAQSEVIEKGLIRADELHSRAPFFLLLLIAAISGHVGETAPDSASSYKWTHLRYLCHLGSSSFAKHHILCRRVLDVVCFKRWMSPTAPTTSCLFLFSVSNNY